MEDKHSPISRTHRWTNNWISPTHTHIYHTSFCRRMGYKAGPRAPSVISRLGPGTRQITHLDCSFSIWILPSASFLNQQGWPATVLTLVEDSGMFGRSINTGFYFSSTLKLRRFPLFPFLSLWPLQTWVTGSHLLAARYVDKWEGGSLCWSQPPGLANHYTPGWALSPAQTQP